MAFELKDEIEIHPSVYVAQTCRIMGRVKIGANSSIWDGVVIRGDMAPITIGENTSIQENAVIHVDTNTPTNIGNNVTVGHGAVVHGAIISDFCIVAIHAVVLNNAHVGEYSIIGAGSIVMERKKIPANSIAFGIPAKVVKKTSDSLKNDIRENARVYVEMGASYLKKIR